MNTNVIPFRARLALRDLSAIRPTVRIRVADNAAGKVHPPARLVCTWRRNAEGGLVCRWRRDGNAVSEEGVSRAAAFLLLAA
ncbi:hypothetical protein [Mesorhizobium comanense]|uniref:hypothetical protein n=1 Tax=Mesorhizobium comanense TaxID=2502215 RepID=UPI0010F4A6CF|nr:hypothetical protein [Mesorhizobium comanense]